MNVGSMPRWEILDLSDTPAVSTDLKSRPARNLRFDLLRIVFATLVLLAHAPELTDGNRSRELFSRFTHSDVTFGVLGVDGFFLISGFLIVQSWESDPEFLNFLRKRLLRIVPGYLVAVALSTLAVGLLAPGIPNFFSHFDFHFFSTVALLYSPATPPVLPGLPDPLVNGPMWTISYEFRCYLLVGLFGVAGILRRRVAWLLIAIGLLGAMTSTWLPNHLWHEHFTVFGDPEQLPRLFGAFFVGGLFWLFRERMPFRPTFALTAAAIVCASAFSARLFELALIVFGGYLMFYFTQQKTQQKRRHLFPDISYGVYLYGWPVESLWIWYVHGSPWVTFVASALICFGLGWLSWHFVERPMLKLKRRSSAPLPG